MTFWRFVAAIAALGVAHTIIYQITARTDYAICASRLLVIGPEQRDALLRRYLLARGYRTNDARLTDCCRFSKDAGEFKLTYSQYLQSGVIWFVKPKSGIPRPGQGFPYVFITNCGKVMDEQTHFDNYVN